MKEVYPGPEAVEEICSRYSFDVAAAQEETVRQKLIELGWTPPEVDEGKDQLMRDMANDIHTLVRENDNIRAHLNIVETELERLHDQSESYARTISQLYKKIASDNKEPKTPKPRYYV